MGSNKKMNEGITLKRKYTDAHPALVVGEHAKIRNAVLNAIAEGTLTNEEVMKIVSEHSANGKKWFSRNQKYFQVSEEGGVSLSAFGKRLYNSIKVNEGRKFVAAATKAKQDGKEEFEFNGKKFPVTVKDTPKVNERKEEIYRCYVEDDRKPGGSDRDIKNDYDLEVTARDRRGFWIQGALDNLNAFIEDYNVYLEEEPFLVEESKFVFESFAAFENSLGEGRKFVAAAKEAKDKGEKEFEFNGKKFPVTINEAFSSMKLQNLMNSNSVGWGSNQLAKRLYSVAKIKLDQITDEDLIETDPQTALKGNYDGAIIYWISDNEKQSPYAENDYYGRIPGGGAVIAITKGKDFYRSSWDRRGSDKAGPGMGLKQGKPGDDTIGINKQYRGYGATGIYNVKRVAEVADRAIILDLSVLSTRYGAQDLRSERQKAKEGAIAFQSDKDFKQANKNRYEQILRQKSMELPLDSIVSDAIDTLSSIIKDSMAGGPKIGKYGDVIIGVNAKGSEIRMRDAAQHMANILDDYSRYVSYLASAKEEESRWGTNGFYTKEASSYAVNIKRKVDQIENGSYVW